MGVFPIIAQYLWIGRNEFLSLEHVDDDSSHLFISFAMLHVKHSGAPIGAFWELWHQLSPQRVPKFWFRLVDCGLQKDSLKVLADAASKLGQPDLIMGVGILVKRRWLKLVLSISAKERTTIAMIYEDSCSMCHLSMHMHDRMNLIQIQINEINEIRWDHVIFNNACKPDGGLHPVRSQGAGDILLISSFVGDLYGVASYYQYSQLVLTCPITYHFFAFVSSLRVFKVISQTKNIFTPVFQKETIQKHSAWTLHDFKTPQKTGLPAAAENFQVEAQFLGPFWEHLKWCRWNYCRGAGWDGNAFFADVFCLIFFCCDSWDSDIVSYVTFKCRLWWIIFNSQQMHGCSFRDFSFFFEDALIKWEIFR